MKFKYKSVVLLCQFLVIFNTALFCQVKDSIKNTYSIVSIPRLNVLYIGIKNQVLVAVPGYPCERIYCSLKKGGKLIGDSGKYFIIPDNTHGKIKEVRLDIFIRNSDTTMSFIDSKIYRIKYIPKPEVYIGTKTGGFISIGEIMLMRFVRASIIDFPYGGLICKVTRFKCTYIPKEGKQETYSVSGSEFSDEINDMKKKLKKGDCLSFTEIYGMIYDTSESRAIYENDIHLNDVMLEIK